MMLSLMFYILSNEMPNVVAFSDK